KTELVEQCLLYFRSITHHLQVPPAKSESVLHSQSKRDFFNTIPPKLPVCSMTRELTGGSRLIPDAGLFMIAI
ncbi:hypothetical protein, partial [Acetobacter fabarum]|uniref:hypothetical protein n=1 Tax=Acetobacter fabarum TaxID=483199 RepID=UPI000BFAF340